MPFCRTLAGIIGTELGAALTAALGVSQNAEGQTDFTNLALLAWPHSPRMVPRRAPHMAADSGGGLSPAADPVAAVFDWRADCTGIG